MGDEFVVNTYMTGDQLGPSVARLAGGGFVIAWTSSRSFRNVWLPVSSTPVEYLLAMSSR